MDESWQKKADSQNLKNDWWNHTKWLKKCQNDWVTISHGWNLKNGWWNKKNSWVTVAKNDWVIEAKMAESL
jgi:hypothetical protein